jgi:CheY-like chemotaxis protein
MSYRIEQPEARILIVDDDDILRGVHEAILSLAGYGTDSAADGEEALAMLATGDFDLVLTDCNMPRLDGLGLVRAMRAAGYRIPVLMVSGSLAGGSELPADVRREVAVALAKPVRSLQLIEGVARALRSVPATRFHETAPVEAAQRNFV